MEALRAYLRDTKTEPDALARAVGVAAERIERILAGQAPDGALARRIVDAAGGALTLEDLSARGAGVVDARAAFVPDADEIDLDRLALALAECRPGLLGESRRKGDAALARLAAEAAANTYVALSTVTSRRGADRLAQALRPVFAEILADLGAAPDPRALDHWSRRTAARYFETPPTARR
jgi:hypothetical protein